VRWRTDLFTAACIATPSFRPEGVSPEWRNLLSAGGDAYAAESRFLDSLGSLGMTNEG
jgi:hypothetical protein